MCRFTKRSAPPTMATRLAANKAAASNAAQIWIV
jgi:hypothetical protein